MALISAINTFQGWTPGQADAFIKHMLGDMSSGITATPVKAPEGTTEINKLTVAELKAEWKRLGIKGANGKTKQVLRDGILNYDPNTITTSKGKKGDKTKPVKLAEDFVKTEFIAKYQAGEVKSSLDLKRAVGKNGFNVEHLLEPVRNEKTGKTSQSTFGATKDNLTQALDKHIETLDLDELAAEEQAAKAAEPELAIVPVKEPDSSEDEADSSDEEDEEDEAPKETEEQRLAREAQEKAEAKKSKKAAKKARKAAEAAEAAAKLAAEAVDSDDDDEPEDQPKPEPEAQPEPEPETKATKKHRRPKKRSAATADTSDLPSTEEETGQVDWNTVCAVGGASDSD